MRIGKNESLYPYLLENFPNMIEDEFFKPHQQAVISVPQNAPEGAVTRHESALHLLDRVTKVWKLWVKPGHRKGANVNNVSTTVSVKKEEWEDVGNWMWEHRDEFTALSVFPADEGDHNYVQMPFEDISEVEFNARIGDLHDIDLTQIVELEDDTVLQEALACSGGSCELH